MSRRTQSQAPQAGSPFDALIFDMGGVLVAHENAVMYARMASRCSRPGAAEGVRALIGEARWAIGAPITALHQTLQTSFGYLGDWEQFAADWCCHLAPDASMIAFARRLAARHRVMIFSNTNAVHWDFLVAATAGGLADFEHYLSHEIGEAKPSAESFRVVAERAGIEARRSVFFDDLAENVEGARRCGFQAEVFEGQAQLAASLAARGVAPG